MRSVNALTAKRRAGSTHPDYEREAKEDDFYGNTGGQGVRTKQRDVNLAANRKKNAAIRDVAIDKESADKEDDGCFHHGTMFLSAVFISITQCRIRVILMSCQCQLRRTRKRRIRNLKERLKNLSIQKLKFLCRTTGEAAREFAL